MMVLLFYTPQWRSVFEFLIPPLEEQKKISEVLWGVEKTVEKIEYLTSITEKIKKRLLNELLTKGIDHKKFKKTEIGEIPETWDVKSLGSLFKLER